MEKKSDEGGGTRTHDLGIKSPLLYQLSYAPVMAINIFRRKGLDKISDSILSEKAPENGQE